MDGVKEITMYSKKSMTIEPRYLTKFPSLELLYFISFLFWIYMKKEIIKKMEHFGKKIHPKEDV